MDVSRAALASISVPFFTGADPAYVLCLVFFACAVIVYVVYGGFRAVVWTDVLQGVIMFIGVLAMLGMVLAQTGGLDKATRTLAKMVPPEKILFHLDGAQQTTDLGVSMGKGQWIDLEGKHLKVTADLQASVDGYQGEGLLYTPLEGSAVPELSALPSGVSIRVVEKQGAGYGAGVEGTYVTAPGPSLNRDDVSGFLSLTLAISFFVFWPFGTLAQPSNMVRLMAFKDTRTLRRAIVTVSIYFSVIYFLLVVIFCCGRVLLPGMDDESDGVMPALATLLTQNAGVPWLAGVLLAAPFAAVMSSVDSFLLMVSSAIVRDVYQNRINPDATEKVLRRLSYGVTAVVGFAAMIAVINPPEYLQDLIIFASGGLAGCFLFPVLLMLFWAKDDRVRGNCRNARWVSHAYGTPGGWIQPDRQFSGAQPF